MSADGLPAEGGCICGQVRFRVSAPPVLTMACHCRGCQQLTSSAFSLSAMFPADGFAVTQGEPVLGGKHREDVEQFYCPHCKGWLFTRPKQATWFVNVRSTLLDAPPPRWTTPYVDMYVSEKLDWVATPAQHSFPKFPELDAFRELMGLYQAELGAT
jgi:hypothetical protein